MFKKIKKAFDVLTEKPGDEITFIPIDVQGDGGAVFLGEGTEEEFIEFEREEQGMKKWYQRIGR